MAKPDPTDKIIDDLIRGKKPEEILGDEGVLKQLTKRLVECALEGKNTGNSRNGKTVKTVIGESDELEITVPRDRTGEFEPKLLPKRQRRLPGFDDKVIALYARGMTTREIQGHLEELYGVGRGTPRTAPRPRSPPVLLLTVGRSSGSRSRPRPCYTPHPTRRTFPRGDGCAVTGCWFTSPTNRRRP